MAEIDDYLDLMTQSVTVEPFLSRTDYGVASYGPPNTYKARVNNKSHLIRTGTGEQIVARGVCWVATSASIGTLDRITLPDGSQPLILDSNLEYSEISALYVRLDLG